MIGGLQIVAGLAHPGSTGEAPAGGEAGPGGFDAVLAAALGPGPAADAEVAPAVEEDDLPAALMPAVVASPAADAAMVASPAADAAMVASPAADAAMVEPSAARAAAVHPAAGRGEAAAVLRAAMLAASPPQRVGGRAAPQVSAMPKDPAAAPASRPGIAVGDDVRAVPAAVLPLRRVDLAAALARPAAPLADLAPPVAARYSPLAQAGAPSLAATAAAMVRDMARPALPVGVERPAVAPGLVVPAVTAPANGPPPVAQPVATTMIVPVAMPDVSAGQARSVVAVAAGIVADLPEVSRPDAGAGDKMTAPVPVAGEIPLSMRLSRGEATAVPLVVPAPVKGRADADARTTMGEALAETVAPNASTVVLPGVSGGNTVVRGASIDAPSLAVALPEAAQAMTVESQVLGPVEIGVEGGEQDLRVHLAGNSLAAATMAAEAPRLLAELAANGLRVQSLAFDGPGLAGDVAGQGGNSGQSGSSQPGSSQPGSDRRPAVAVATGQVRPAEAPAAVLRPRISERYA